MDGASKLRPLPAPSAPLRHGAWAFAQRAGRIALELVAALACLTLLAAFALAAMGFRATPIDGRSMGDALPYGSVAFFDSVAPERLTAGDVIAVKRPDGAPFVHRITRIETHDGKRLATLKGDANSYEDAEPLFLRGRVSRVVFHVPWLGLLARAAGGDSLLLFVLAVALVTAIGVIDRAYMWGRVSRGCFSFQRFRRALSLRMSLLQCEVRNGIRALSPYRREQHP